MKRRKLAKIKMSDVDQVSEMFTDEGEDHADDDAEYAEYLEWKRWQEFKAYLEWQRQRQPD